MLPKSCGIEYLSAFVSVIIPTYFKRPLGISPATKMSHRGCLRFFEYIVETIRSLRSRQFTNIEIGLLASHQLQNGQRYLGINIHQPSSVNRQQLPNLPSSLQNHLIDMIRAKHIEHIVYCWDCFGDDKVGNFAFGDAAKFVG